MNWIDFNAYNSMDFTEMIVQELPPIIKPAKRTNIRYIDGADGAIVEELGYDMIEKTVIFGLKNTTNINTINTWLSGTGEVRFSNEPDCYYNARIVGEIDYERLGRFRTASVTFLCQPYKYDFAKASVLHTSTGTKTAVNIGTVDSLPKFVIVATDTVAITVNGAEITLEMDAENNQITIDSEIENAYYTTTGALKNSIMTGDFPIFTPGNNTVVLAGTFTSIRIYPQSRFI